MIRCEPSHPQPPLFSPENLYKPPARLLQRHKNILSNQKQKKKIIHHSSSSIFVGFFRCFFFQWSSIIHSHDGLLKDTFLFRSLGWEKRRFPGWHSGYEGAMPTEWYQRLKKKKKKTKFIWAFMRLTRTLKFNSSKKGNVKSILPSPGSNMPLFFQCTTLFESHKRRRN